MLLDENLLYIELSRCVCYFTYMNKGKTSAVRRRRGQTLVEYALILAIISVVAIGVLITMGGQVKTIYSNINSSLSAAGSSH